MQCHNFPQTLISQYTGKNLFHDTRKEDIFNLIEILQTTNDINLQMKLLLVLGAYIMSNGTYAELVITFKPIYYKILDILNSGHTTHAARTLNFLNVLLTYDDVNYANRKTFSVFARNMSRVSGCLGTMSDMFVSCMMYQDTWVALCQCLAEACRDCRINQDYCSHLVPVCIKKCNQNNMEVLSILDSLLQGHDGNIKLFLHNNGTEIFTRQMLQQNICMQLLNTVVRDPEAKDILQNSKIIDYLHYFIKCHGQNSQIGLWSMVILYRISPRDNAPQLTNKSDKKNEVSKLCNISRDQEDVFQINDTTHLFQNIIQEIGNWKSSKEPCFKKPLVACKRAQNIVNQNFAQRNSGLSITNDNKCNEQSFLGFKKYNNVYPKTSRMNLKYGHTNLSFSTILNEMENELHEKDTNFEQSSKYHTSNNSRKHFNVVRYCEEQFDKIGNEDRNNESSEESKIFEPAFTSTPYKKYQEPANTTTPSKIQRTTLRNIYKKRKDKSHKQKKVKQTVKNDMNKNTSFSSRFMSVINDSCTTLVKSVKNIFRHKENYKKPCPESAMPSENESSHSFTNFMDKRGAALHNENKYNTQNTCSNEFSKDDMCTTCEDTRILRNKLESDKCLEETIRKLKLGINLYGCDFKKISRIVFAKERYMTPKVLYSIYRKLIVK